MIPLKSLILIVILEQTFANYDLLEITFTSALEKNETVKIFPTHQVQIISKITLHRPEST
jgi:hypothetical protein